MWVGVLTNEAGSVDPVGFFWSGARASGNNAFTRRGSFPLCFLEKRDEVPNLVDSFIMEKRTERPLLWQANTGSSQIKRSRYIRVGLPTPHIDRHLVVRKKCLRIVRSTPQIYCHHLIWGRRA